MQYEDVEEKPKSGRMMEMEAMDNEFEIEVANSMGYPGRESIDASKAKLLEGRYNLQGFALPDDSSTERLVDTEMRYAPLRKQNPDMKLEPGNIYAVGAQNANPQIWSHEFRHQAFEGMSESTNRLQDAYYSNSEDEWQKSIRSWADQRRTNDMEWAEKDLIKRLNRMRAPDKEKGEARAKDKFLGLLEYEVFPDAPWKRFGEKE